MSCAAGAFRTSTERPSAESPSGTPSAGTRGNDTTPSKQDLLKKPLPSPTFAPVERDAAYSPRERFISVLIPTKNRAPALREALRALERQTYRQFEVVIVDGNSTDDTPRVPQEFAATLSITFASQEGGLIAQENVGWRRAKGDVVVRTDDDAVADPRWLESINEAFNLSRDVGGCTGPTVIPNDHRACRDIFAYQERFRAGSPFWRGLGRFYYGYLLEGRPFDVSRWFASGAFSLGSNVEEHAVVPRPIEVSHHEACNMAVRRDLLEAVGGFDPTYRGIGEYNEPDVSFNVRRLGYRLIYHPGARVSHMPSKEGFFKERPAAYGRMLNFVTFYFQHVKPNSWRKATRFAAYLAFQNAFFVYKFFATRQWNQLGALGGTAVGLARYAFRPSSWRGGLVL